MSLRENLAVNLRRLCAERGSIAAVCREMGINRQQFDRYLSMDALPNRATTARICEYFGIEEAALYRNPDAPEGLDSSMKPGRFRAQDGSISARIFAPPRPTIAPGFYQTFFSIPEIADQAICALTAIRVDGERMTFRRLTGLAEGRGTRWSYFMGDHEGVVFERLNWFYLVGLNRRGPREPTTVAVQWGPFSEQMLVGHAMIVTPAGPSVTTVAMRAVPKGISLRKALRDAHVYQTSDPMVGPLVESALKKRYMPMP